MAKSVLITGVNGFVGRFVAGQAKRQGLRVVGVGRHSLAADLRDLVDDYHTCDLADLDATLKLRLDDDVVCVVNLAGLASVGGSFADPKRYQDINVGIAENVARLIAKNGNRSRHLYISSGAVYDPGQTLPLEESSALAKTCSPYAESKIAAEKALGSFIVDGQDVIIMRPFNHAGPYQLAGFLLPDLAEQIMTAEPGSTIKVGNLATKRDYTHVDDVAEAYIAIATTPKDELSSTIYNVCSSQPVAGTQIFDSLAAALRPGQKIGRIIDKSKIRPDDPHLLYGSYDLLNRDVGWQPVHDINSIVKDFADWYLKRPRPLGRARPSA